MSASYIVSTCRWARVTRLPFTDEPVGEVARQPKGSKLVFTRDAGGSEFSQIFLLDPAGGDAQMLTDGESRNGAILWDREGRRLAYQSTRRNGASNDIWLMDPENPDERQGRTRVARRQLVGAVGIFSRRAPGCS